MALRRPLPCESAGIAGRRRTPAVQPRRPPRLPGPQTANCPQMMTTDSTGSVAGDIPRGRVRSAPAGDSPRVRGQSARSGTGIPSPTAPKVPVRTRLSPGRDEVPAMSGVLAQAAPLAAPPATGTPVFPTSADRPSAQTSGRAPQVRGRRSKRTGPGPVLDACLG